MQDLDFIEIGTSNFDTLLEKCSENEYGISVEPLKNYLDDLPEKRNVKKINCAVTHGKMTDFIDMYYIPKNKIKNPPQGLRLVLVGRNGLPGI